MLKHSTERAVVTRYIAIINESDNLALSDTAETATSIQASMVREITRRAGLWTVAIVAVALSSVAPPQSWAQPGYSKVSYLDQGWGADQRNRFYYTSQGSQLIPYQWFLALEQPADKKPFTDPAFMSRLGYLPMPKNNDRNPDGLPVGFVKDENRVTVRLKLNRLAA